MCQTLDIAKVSVHRLLVFIGVDDEVVDEALYQIDVEHEFVESHKVTVNLAELPYALTALQQMHVQVAIY